MATKVIIQLIKKITYAVVPAVAAGLVQRKASEIYDSKKKSKEDWLWLKEY